MLITGGAQAAVQLLGFAAGILAIRNLAPAQFACYTVATAMLGSMAALTDSGLTNSIMAEGGRVWQDRTRLGAVLTAGIRLRRQLAMIAVPLALPVLALLLHRQGAGWQEIVALCITVTLLFLTTFSSQLLEAVPRLHQSLIPLQRIHLVAATGRLFALALVLPFWPLAAVATMCAVVPQWWNSWRVRALACQHADLPGDDDPELRQRLRSQVLRTMPGVLYYSISGQLSIWLVSVFGHSADVATVGALGRLAMILSLVGAVMNLIAVPRFARIPAANRSLLQRRFWQLQCLCAAGCALPILAITLFPEPALAILGRHYQGLQHEALLMAASSAVSTIGGLAYVLAATRGIVASPLLLLPWSIGCQIILVLVLPVNTVTGVIWIGLLAQLSQWLLHTAWFVWKSRHS
jgi:O-antigen/teichoic acid export membrane protein